jgi:hypothetical protein
MLEFVGKNTIILAESEFSAKTNSFLKVKSKERLVTGVEYLFSCDGHDKTHIIGQPLKINT